MVDRHTRRSVDRNAGLSKTGQYSHPSAHSRTKLLIAQANVTYVLWVTAYNTSFLFGYLALELSLFPIHSTEAVPPLLEAINANGLAVFLVANVLTGLVNVSMKTMYADARTSMIVLLGYSVAVCGLAWVGRNLHLKLG